MGRILPETGNTNPLEDRRNTVSHEMKVTLRSIATIMVVIAMILAFLIAGIRLFGLQPMGVLSGSMEPTYSTGSLIYVKDVDYRDLDVRDVITYKSGKSIVTHRIIEVVNEGGVKFRTQGDANDNADATLVSPGNVLGKVVFSIPFMGYVANFIQHPPGTYWAIAFSVLLIAFVFITDSVASGKEDDKPPKESKAGKWISDMVDKYLPFLKKKETESPGYTGTGYSPQRPAQPVQTPQSYPQQMPQRYPQQSYPQQMPQYPQQGYPQQMQPQYPRQGYPQQVPQQYPQQRPTWPVQPQQGWNGYGQQPQQGSAPQWNGNSPWGGNPQQPK